MWVAVLVALLGLCSCQEEVYKPTIVPLPTATTTPVNRIIGGSPATITRYPFTVQVLINSQLTCGGSLITRRHVLSAAHCFVDANNNNRPISPTFYSIRAGSATLGTGGQVRSVSTIVLHEGYDVPLRDNDVAVLVLASALELGAAVATVSIPQQGATVPDGSSVTIVGWGWTDTSLQQVSQVLNEVVVYMIEHGVCEQRYLALQTLTREPFPVTSSMVCAGVLDVGGRDACRGDSGGPLIYNGVVVGVTSWGAGCAEAYYPGVYARVASYTNWINSTVTLYNAAPPLVMHTAALTVLSLVLSMIASS